MKINRLSQLKIFSAIFAAALSGGSAYASDPGVTDTEIVIGLHAPLSGPLAALRLKSRTDSHCFRVTLKSINFF